MAKKTETIFDRAEAAATNGTAKQCSQLIAELERIVAEDEATVSEVRPPGQHLYNGDGSVYGTLYVGSRFEAASLADDDKAIAECQREFEKVTARLDKSGELIDALKKRAPIAEAAEKRAAAPGQAKAAIAELDDLLDHHAAAIAEFVAVHQRLTETFNSLLEARRLDPSAPTLTVEQFYRTGTALAYLPPQRRQTVEDYGGAVPPRVNEPLFGDGQTAFLHAKALVEIPKSVWQRTRELMAQRNPAGRGLDAHWSPDGSDTAVRARLDD